LCGIIRHDNRVWNRDISAGPLDRQIAPPHRGAYLRNAWLLSGFAVLGSQQSPFPPPSAALQICKDKYAGERPDCRLYPPTPKMSAPAPGTWLYLLRSEEHTSELQSR